MPTRSKILIVDDNPTNIKIIKEVLGSSFEFASAGSGEEALAVVPGFQPDIVLLDVMMPGIDGYEVCRRIRQDHTLRHTKIIMLSAKAMVSERLQGYQAGADDYITKPFDKDEFLAKVRVYLSLKSVEEIDQLKTDVLSLISHDTRSPFSGILPATEMLMSDDELDTKERKALAEVVHQSAERLLAFFEKALMFSELKSGRAEFHRAETDLCQIISNAVSEADWQAVEHKVEIKQHTPEMTLAHIDGGQIKFVISAILDNAVRFSPPGGQVMVELWPGNDCVVVTVTDQGKGIDSDYLPYVFDDFVRADVRGKTESLAMSLAVCREIINAHEGRIWTDSNEWGGATFSFGIPMAIESQKERECVSAFA